MLAEEDRGGAKSAVNRSGAPQRLSPHALLTDPRALPRRDDGALIVCETRVRRLHGRSANRSSTGPRSLSSLPRVSGGGGGEATSATARTVRRLSGFDFMSPTGEKTMEPPEGYTVLQEGKARILQQANDVFYNKAQVVNRDLSLAVMRQFQKCRAKEHETDKRAPKNKRMRGELCATPKDSPILPHLLTPEEIDDMFKTQAERDAEEQKARDEGKDAPSSAAGGEDDDAAPKEKPR